jgi:hypothetical protein
MKLHFGDPTWGGDAAPEKVFFDISSRLGRLDQKNARRGDDLEDSIPPPRSTPVDRARLC